MKSLVNNKDILLFSPVINNFSPVTNCRDDDLTIRKRNISWNNYSCVEFVNARSKYI